MRVHGSTFDWYVRVQDQEWQWHPIAGPFWFRSEARAFAASVYKHLWNACQQDGNLTLRWDLYTSSDNVGIDMKKLVAGITHLVRGFVPLERS
jgi:hypothetical protein